MYIHPIDPEIEKLKRQLKIWLSDYKNELYNTMPTDANHFSNLIFSEYTFLKYYKKYNDYIEQKYPVDYLKSPIYGNEPTELDMNFVDRFLLTRGVRAELFMFNSIRDDFESQLEVL